MPLFCLVSAAALILGARFYAVDLERGQDAGGNDDGSRTRA